MNPIINPTEVGRYQEIVFEMTLKEPRRKGEFDPRWVRSHGWAVVPVEDASHFAPEEIAVLVPALRKVGFRECFAVATQSVEPDGIPAYSLAISEEDFQSFNAECGPLRYLLTDKSCAWAISCNEWYNLFAGPPKLVEAMLGKSLEGAREEFLDYAILLASGRNPDESILQAARHYAAL
jgi:hypothetical protein